MGILEILLISIGLSFDVFVVHICVGARKRHNLIQFAFWRGTTPCIDPGKCCCRYSEAGQEDE